jgi:phage tail tape measure protein, lambda family
VDIASLGIKVTSDGITEAEDKLDRLTTAGESAADAAKATGDAWSKAANEISSNTGSILGELQALNKTQTSSLAVADSIRSSFESLSAQLEKLGSSFGNVESSSTATAAAVKDVGESNEQAAARIKEMVRASLAQADAQAAVKGSAEATAEATGQVAGSFERVVTAQNRAMASTRAIADEQAKAAAAGNGAKKSLSDQGDELARLVGQIDPAVAALGRLDAMEEKLKGFRAKGLVSDDDFADLSGKIDANRAALGKYQDTAGKVAMSQRAIAAANRNLPAQFTDIATGIASGQKPLTVLLQQGGQLKDMYGGIGPALKAIGGYALGLINPITILTGVAAGLGLAWKQGSDESDAFNKALITTGNVSGKTTEQLQSSAREISRYVGTQHEAAAALAEVAGSGKFTAEQIDLVGQAALNMSRLTGQSTAETIKQFEQLKDNPVKAVLALNDSEHFLTTSIYERIKALQDSGREDEASTVAMKARADALNDRAKDVQASAGIMVRAWNTVTGAAKSAWDAMLDVGRPDSSDAQIKKIQDRMEAVRTRSGPMYADLTDRQQASILASYQKSLDTLMGKERQAEEDARQRSIAAGAVQALADSDREADQYASREEKRAKAIVAARAKAQDGMIKAFAAGDIKAAAQIQANQAVIEKGINEQFKDPKQPKGRQRVDPDFYTEDRRQIEAEIAAEGKLQDQRSRSNAAAEAYQATLNDMLDTRQAEIKLQVSSIGMSQLEAQRQQVLTSIKADAAKKQIQLVHDMNQTTDQDTKDQYARELASLQDYTNKRVAMEIAGFQQEDAARSDWKRGVQGGYAEVLASASDVSGQTRNLFVNSFDSMADALTNFVTKGKLDFKGLVSSILTELAKMEIRIAASQALQAIFGSFSGGGGATVAANAKGGVYDSPSLSNYSNQVVSEPTFFKFAKGGALGVMGEAGSEAIMPLSRGSNGRLGVTVNGGSQSMGGIEINVAVTVNSDGSSDVTASGDNTAFGKQFGTAVANVCKQQIAQEIKPGGQIYNAVKR